MKKIKVKEKIKKLFLIVITFVTIAFMMPAKSKADIANDFINLVLRIPDGIMHVIDHFIGGSKEFTFEEVKLKGNNLTGGAIYNFIVTPYDIFSSGTYEIKDSGNYYTKLGLFDINFFADRDIESGTKVSSEVLAPVIGNIYVSLRNLALVLMMLVVLYIGIKIMVSSIAAQQAKYKQLLVDWLVGFALLFMMHYIMSGVVHLNTIVVKLLSNSEGDSYYVGIAELKDDINTGKNDTDSTWIDIMEGVANDTMSVDKLNTLPIVTYSEFISGKEIVYENKYDRFLTNRIIVKNGTSDSDTFSHDEADGGSDHVKQNPEKLNAGELIGELNINDAKAGKQTDGALHYTSNKGYRRYYKLGDDKDSLEGWGDNGKIQLSAKLINPGVDKNVETVTGLFGVMNAVFFDPKNKDYENKAIAKLNTMSYIRTISSFGSEDNDSVILFEHNGQSKLGMAGIFGYSILYLCLVIETVMFVFIYLKRVLQMSFLTMVAPIVAIMYPVDKIGDGKAQAFNTWFKDYLFNILIQPMHLLLYTVFIVAASELSSGNIIYAIAIYGFMIPSEKYFKKILGFEKASGGGGGPMSNALGRSLAMDGLGRLTGLGPAGRSSGGGKSGGTSKTRKVGKNDPSATDSNGNINPLGGGDSGTGGGSVLPKTKKSSSKPNSVNQNAKGISPMLGQGKQQGIPKSIANVLRRRISRAATGGRYSDLRTPGAGRAAIGNIARHGLRGGARLVGTAGIGAVGLMAGAATAMTTGDINNVWRGAVTGVAAGNKLSSNIFDRADDGITAFVDEASAERAANDAAYNKEYQKRQTFELLDEDLAALNGDEREEYIKIIEQYADVTNLDSIDKVEALANIRKTYGSIDVEAARAQIIDDAQKRENEAEKRRAEAEQRINSATNADERRKAEEAMRKAQDEINQAQAEKNYYTTTSGLGANQKTGADALKYAKRYNNVLTDPNKVLNSLIHDEKYDKLEAVQMLELIKAGKKKLK